MERIVRLLRKTAAVAAAGLFAVPALAEEPAGDASDGPDEPQWLNQVETYNSSADFFDRLGMPPFAETQGGAKKPAKAPVEVYRWRRDDVRGLFGKTKEIDGRVGRITVGVDQPQGGALDLGDVARVNLASAVMSMNAQLSASFGRDEDKNDLWRKSGAAVEMHWQNVPKTNISLTGSENFSQVYRNAAAIGDAGRTQHLLQTGRQAANFAVEVAPMGGVTLETGASVSGETTGDASARRRDGESERMVENDVRSAFAKLSLRPADWLSVEAGGEERDSRIAVKAVDGQRSDYKAFEPRLALTLGPDGALSWRTVFEHTDSGYNTDAFVTYAGAAKKNESLTVVPDHAWQLRTEVAGTVAGADLAASYAASRDGTATEYALLESGTQAPVSVALKKRDEADVRLTLPLSGLGIRNTSLVGDAAWRQSRIFDPVTGKYRRASGEIPRRMSLKLERKIPKENLRFGLTGAVSAAQTSYQARQISEVGGSETLGAFVAYKPGAYEVNLDVDGLVGTPATTVYSYDGSRAVNQLPRISGQPPQGPSVKLSLHRKL